MLPPKRVHLSAGRGGAEAHRRDRVAALRQRQRDAGVEHVAGRQRVDRVDLEHRHGANRAAGQIAHRRRAVADGEERLVRGAMRCSPAARSSSPVVARRHSPEKMTWVGMPKQRIVLDGRPVGVEHHRNAAPPRRLADRPHEVRESGCRRAAARRPATSRSGSATRAVSIRLSRWVTIIRSPAASTMMPDTGAVAPATRTTPVVSMPSRAISADELVADVVVRVAERPGVMRAAAEPRHRDRGVDRAAAADDDEFVGHALAAGRRKLRRPGTRCPARRCRRTGWRAR